MQVNPELISKYRPVVYLHSKEKYHPSNVETYLQECKLKKLDTNEVKNIENFNAMVSDGSGLHGYTLFLPNGMDSNVIKNNNLNEAPLYVKTFDLNASFYITYMFFYAYNGPALVFDKFKYEKYSHYADVERITLKIDKESQAVKEVYFSQHSGGHWLSSKDVEFEGYRPVVYSALNSHASYSKPGRTARFWGVVGDVCDKGIRWDTNNLVILGGDDDDWKNNFLGDLGDGRVSSFASQTCWKGPEENAFHGEQCWFCSSI